MQRRVATLLILFAGLVPGVATRAQEKSAPPPSTQPLRKADPKMAYALGLGMGQRLREEMHYHGIQADNDLIVRGLIDGLNDLPSLYPDDEMMAAIAKIESPTGDSLDYWGDGGYYGGYGTVIYGNRPRAGPRR